MSVATDSLDRSVGIIGAGRLGSALAFALIDRGLPRERLFLSTRGGAESAERLAGFGLSDRLVQGEEAVSADLVVLAVRPQDALALGRLPCRPAAAAIACVAGLSLEAARSIVGPGATRAMTSGPDTILEGNGVAAVCPGEGRGAFLLEMLDLGVVRLDDEAEMDCFTAAVCMPAAFALIGAETLLLPLDQLATELPRLANVFHWVPSVSPGTSASDEERAAYLKRMITPGGVTERLVEALRAGMGVRDAYYEAVSRARALGAAVRAAKVST